MARLLVLALQPAERGLLLGVGGLPCGGRHVIGVGSGEMFEIPTLFHLVHLDELIDLPRKKFFTTEGEMVWIYETQWGEMS